MIELIGNRKTLVMNFKSFKSLAGYLDSIPFINCGGCGISAYFIYEYFKEHSSKLAKPEIVFWYRDESDVYYKNEEALKGNGKPTSCSHVAVKFNGVYYDSEGAHKSFYYDKYHIVSEEFLIEALKDKKHWNHCFDRDQEVPEMEKKIGINLPKL